MLGFNGFCTVYYWVLTRGSCSYILYIYSYYLHVLYWYIYIYCNIILFIQVLASGLVFKHDPSATTTPTVTTTTTAATTAPAQKQRRILLLTTSPRLLFLDPIGNIVRGSLDLCTNAVVDVNIVSLHTLCYILYCTVGYIMFSLHLYWVLIYSIYIYIGF